MDPVIPGAPYAENVSMRISSFGNFVPVFWIVAEIIAYGIVIQKFGIAVAVLIGIVSLALGLFAFRRLGLSMAAVRQDDFATPDALWASFKRVGWAALGAFLLILPGFLTNVIGLALLILNPQAWLTPDRTVRSRDSEVIDLDPSDWSSGTNEKEGPPKSSAVAPPGNDLR